MKKFVALAILLVITAVGAAAIVAARSKTPVGSVDEELQSPAVLQAEPDVVEKPDEKGQGMAAIDEAAQAGKYLFAFFRKADDEQTAGMQQVFHRAMEKVADRANSVEIDITDESEKAIVDKFDVDRAPMPLVLAVAPNGAITGGFPTKFEEQQLLDAFATPCTASCMKSLQDSKLVLVCIQNATTELNDEAMQGVRDLKADSQLGNFTEVVKLDPADPAEAGLLKDLDVSPDTKKATTVFLAPPGVAIGKYEGATTKDEFVEMLQKASSACGPGGTCGPGGCKPKE